MRNITNVSSLIRRLHANRDQFSEQEDFNVEFSRLMSETVLSKDNICRTVFMVYQYPTYVEYAVSQLCYDDIDYQEAAISVYRRILSGAACWDIRRDDVFPLSTTSMWLAPWCVGFLKEKPIRHEDICTFYAIDSTIVSPHQLRLIDEYGHIPSAEHADFEFEVAYNLEDSDCYESSEESSDIEDMDSLLNYANSVGLNYESIDVLASANVIDIVSDPICCSLGEQFSPLTHTYIQRVVKVAALLYAKVCEDFDHLSFEIRDVMGFWSVLCELVHPLKQKRWAFTHPAAKLMFTLYPVLFDKTSHADYLNSLQADFIKVMLGNDVKTQYFIRNCFQHYGHYPVSFGLSCWSY